MRVMYGSEIIQAMYEFFLDYGKPPKIFYTNFVKRMIKVDTQKWLLANKSKNVATPSGCQIQNRPMKRIRCSIMETRRAYLTKNKFPQEYWFYTISYAEGMLNICPGKLSQCLTTPYELVHGEKHDMTTI